MNQLSTAIQQYGRSNRLAKKKNLRWLRKTPSTLLKNHQPQLETTWDWTANPIGITKSKAKLFWRPVTESISWFEAFLFHKLQNSNIFLTYPNNNKKHLPTKKDMAGCTTNRGPKLSPNEKPWHLRRGQKDHLRRGKKKNWTKLERLHPGRLTWLAGKSC